jgi:ABC-2 type transport system ATP-binding protein
MTDPITIDDVYKSFGSTKALQGLSLTVGEGSVHGFLGPNGSGKSTTIRILLGLIRADRGSVTLLGGDPWNDTGSVHQRVAYVPGDVNLWPQLTGGEVIDLLGRLRGGLDPVRRADLVDRFELDPTKRGRAYSKGNRQKVVLIAALAARADLYIFDEPTAGLDPLMEETFRRCVEERRRDGATVLLSSHILSEVEALCDHVSIIREGAIVEHGSMDELRSLSRTTVTATLQTVPDDLSSWPGVHSIRRHGSHVIFDVDDTEMTNTMTALAAAGLLSLHAQPPSLEELFLQEYTKDPGSTS